MNQVNRVCRLVLVSLLAACALHGQVAYKAVFERPAYTDTLYAVRSDKTLLHKSGRAYPEYDAYADRFFLPDSYDCKELGAQPAQLTPQEYGIMMKDTAQARLCFLRQISSRAYKPDSATVLYQRVYISNIKSYSFLLLDRDNTRVYKKTVYPKFQGYQQPDDLPLAEWEVDSLRATNSGGTGMMLAISYERGNAHGGSTFNIGDMMLAEKTEVEYAVNNGFFKSILGDGYLAGCRQYRNTFVSSFIENPSYDFDSGFIFPVIKILPVNGGDTTSTNQCLGLLDTLLLAAARNYPFYTEKQIIKDSAISRLRWVCASQGSRPDPAKCVADINSCLLHTYNDPHFFIDPLTDDDLVKSPIRITQLNNEYVVAAVLDTIYNKNMLNSRVTAIDGICIDKYADSIASQRLPEIFTYKYQKFLLLSELLDRHSTDTARLTFVNPATGKEETENIVYNRKYPVPANFRSVDYELKKLSGGIVSFRVREWDNNSYLRLINNWDEISKAEGLILDIRGNGGGSLYQTLHFLSVFLARPIAFAGKRTGNDKPMLILPDKYYNYPPGKKVVIIGDFGTGCASEAFVSNMKKLSNVTFIAATNTYGTFANRHDIRLPCSDIVLKVNTLAHKMLLGPGNDQCIEWKGISPDKVVSINSVSDMKPYDDKLFQEAIKMLSEKTLKQL